MKINALISFKPFWDAAPSPDLLSSASDQNRRTRAVVTIAGRLLSRDEPNKVCQLKGRDPLGQEHRNRDPPQV
jgi:hypothetical protein